MFIKESLRLYPPVPIIARQLDNDMILKSSLHKSHKSVASRGSRVQANIFALHRNETTWDKPEVTVNETFVMNVSNTSVNNRIVNWNPWLFAILAACSNRLLIIQHYCHRGSGLHLRRLNHKHSCWEVYKLCWKYFSLQNKGKICHYWHTVCNVAARKSRPVFQTRCLQSRRKQSCKQPSTH